MPEQKQVRFPRKMDKSEQEIFMLCLEGVISDDKDQLNQDSLDEALLKFNLVMRDDEAEYFLTI